MASVLVLASIVARTLLGDALIFWGAYAAALVLAAVSHAEPVIVAICGWPAPTMGGRLR